MTNRQDSQTRQTYTVQQPRAYVSPEQKQLANEIKDEVESENYLHAQCEDWSHWCKTRRFFGAPHQSTTNMLANKGVHFGLHKSTTGGPNAHCSAATAALNMAILSQPMALDRQVFELYYKHRVHNITRVAEQLKISRQHFYRLLRAFRRRVVGISSGAETFE